MFNFRLVAYAAAAALAAVVFAYGIGRYQGSVSERKACEAEIHAAELTAERQARETERKAQEAQNAIVEDYEHQIADYRRTVDAYVDADRLSDTRSCKAVPGDTADKPGFVCYTPADIQRKIKESLDIAAECDELAIKYNALLKSYRGIYKHDDD